MLKDWIGMLKVPHWFKMATGSHGSPPLRPFEIDGELEAIDSLSLDFGRYERVNRWKGMPECDEFVGARYKSRKFTFMANIDYSFADTAKIALIKVEQSNSIKNELTEVHWFFGLQCSPNKKSDRFLIQRVHMHHFIVKLWHPPTFRQPPGLFYILNFQLVRFPLKSGVHYFPPLSGVNSRYPLPWSQRFFLILFSRSAKYIHTFMQMPAVKRIKLIIQEGTNGSLAITCLSAANVFTQGEKSDIFWPTCKKSKVCIEAKWRIRPELIPVSLAWSD